IAQLARFPAESPTPVLRISGDGTIFYANNASRLLLKHLKQLNGRILPDNFSVSFAELLVLNKIHQQEVICGEITYMLTISPQPGEGELNLYAADITERRQAEELNKKSLSLLEATIESTADGILVVDRKGSILCFNQKFINMWRIPAEVMTLDGGKEVQDLMLSQLCESEKFSVKVKEMYKQPKATSFDVLTFKDGRVFERYSQPQQVNGVAVGRVWSFRDITERKQTMQKLEQTMENLRSSNRDLEQFAYIASHDLQEPLRMVANYLQLIDRRYRNKLDQDGVDFIGYAVDGAVRMQQLIDSLLDYSRLQTRKRPFETVNLEQILQRTFRDLEDRIVETGATVRVDPLPKVTGDPVQLALVLQNLVGNALKFRDKNQPEVHIYAEETSACWKISVCDNGIGIEPEHYERIFKIFQRLNNRTDYPGTGIGLAICRRVIERHGGEIGVKSVIGKGSVFWFTLPKRGERQL
ncbi:MAG: ATP-binding protein, partial [Pontiellaceae bacterium]|nr:ATP-binding protein [Pontiellaceae bacterium]